ncbi:MAG: PEP/pyruvate-binding domain-containing protein [Planctomycetota bacterium]
MQRRVAPWLSGLSAVEAAAPGVGPKAGRLGQLVRAGLLVPPGFVIPAEAAATFLGDDPRQATSAPFPPDFLAALGAALEGLDPEQRGVAVRSAALDEDADEASAAGIYLTRLGRRGLNEVVTALRECWASAGSEAARAYFGARGRPAPTTMSVIVQRMVEPRLAGVMFTSRDGGRVWVEAVEGRGEALVSGEVDPVRYRLDPGAPPAVEGAPLDLVPEPLLEELVALARRAEVVLGPGLDLEWAWAPEEGLVLLQARPVTRELRAAERRVKWTAANSQEALLDPVTPLTWSLLAPLVESGRRDLFRFAGLREVAGDYMRLFHGRPYFNPDYFRAFLRQVPGAPENVFDALIFAESAPQIEFRPGEFDLTTLRLVALFLLGRLFARERFELFLRSFALRLAPLTARPLETLYDAELLGLRARATDLLEAALRRHVLGTALSGGAYLLLDLFLRHAGDAETRAPGLASRLTAGASGNALAEASAELEELARRWRALPAGQREEELLGFLARHGHRCEKEAELLEPRWADDPRPVREVLERYVAAVEAGGLIDLRRREAELSERARELAREVTRRLGRASWLERVLPLRRLTFGYLLREARRYAPYRENLKDQALRALHLLRGVYLELGRRLAARGLLERAEDAFFLEVAPLEAALARGACPAELRARVVAARAARELDLGRPAPTHVIEVPGRPARELWADEARASLLEGVGVSSGRVVGVARVLHSMDEAARLAPGEVLVARVINAAWTPLFHLAGAIVAEVGGVLSHGAIVAREYGIPAVFGVPGASRIPNGARVCVDGDLGIVTLEPGE